MRTLVWFRNDLRLADNPALHDAATPGAVVGCFLIAHRQWREHGEGEARLAFVQRSLAALRDDLAQHNIPLRVRSAPTFADAPAALLALAREVRAERVAFNVEYPYNEQQRDAAVTAALRTSGVDVTSHHADVVQPPGAVLTGSAEPFSVFSAFRRRWLALTAAATLDPLPDPGPQRPLDVTGSWQDIPAIDPSHHAERWPAGEAAARHRLESFIADDAPHYAARRDFPAQSGTSELSPYLAVGSVSARQCLAAAVSANGGRLSSGVEGTGGLDPWVTELIWREFYRHVIALFPHVSRGRAFNRARDALPWRDAPKELAAWQAGRTGYPLVDAGMRQLNATGWMHNRLRMVTAMFLTKHLLIDWRHGERYFMEHLADADFASNNGGWQWSASTGTDAAPYFRIFNPTLQGRRFDPDGHFTRTMVPELEAVPDGVLFEPWRHPGHLDYPPPLVDHRAARQRALDFFKDR